MKIKNTRCFALGALTLLGAAALALPARAQDAAPADNGKPITLNLLNVPLQASLQTLFSSAGIRNYQIDPQVQGFANINVGDVPFATALRQLLSQATPPATFEVENGIYHVKVAQATPPPAATVVPSATVADNAGGTSTSTTPKTYYKIPIDKYDAYYIATLLGASGGIIPVDVNRPIAFGGAAQGGQGGGGFGNQGGGIGGNSFGGGLSAPVTSIGGNSSFGGGSSYGGGRGYGGGSSFGGGSSYGGGYR